MNLRELVAKRKRQRKVQLSKDLKEFGDDIRMYLEYGITIKYAELPDGLTGNFWEDMKLMGYL